MSGIASLRIASPLETDLGLDVFGRRLIIPTSIDEQIVETNQMFPDNGVSGDKIASLTVDKLKAGSINVNTYIQSTGFVTGTTGWKIDGAGNAEFANLTLTSGTIKYGKTSFADSTNAGYHISSSGIYFGSASDASYLKYDITGATLNFKGILTATSGTIGGFTIGATTLSGGTINGGTLIGNIFTTSNANNTSRISISDATYGTPAQAANSLAVVSGSTKVLQINPATGSVGGFYINATPAASDSQGVLYSTSADTSDLTGDATFGVIKLEATHASGKISLLSLQQSGDGRCLIIASAGTTYAPVVVSGGIISTKFRKMITGSNRMIWESTDTTSPNTALSGTAGDLCMCGDGNIYRCTGTTNWTAM